jgi:exonuclease I
LLNLAQTQVFMPLFPELTLLILLFASPVIYMLVRFFNSRPKYQIKRNELLEKFQVLRLKSKTLQDVLSQHILSSDANKKSIGTETITYGEYFKYLQRNHIQNLSDKEYAKLKNTHNRIQQKKTADMLEEQEMRLAEAEKKLAHLL